MGDYKYIHYKGMRCPICGAEGDGSVFCGYCIVPPRKEGYVERVELSCYRYNTFFGRGGTAFMNAATGGITVNCPLFSSTEFVFLEETPGGFGHFMNLDYFNVIKRLEEKGYSKESKEKREKKSYTPKVYVSSGKETKVQKENEDVPVASEEERDKFYCAFLDEHCVEDSTIDMLVKHDGWPLPFANEVFKKYGIVTCPIDDMKRYSDDSPRKAEYKKLYPKSKSRKAMTQGVIDKRGIPKGIPGFYQRENGVWTFGGLDGYYIPIYNTKGQIIELRLRLADGARKELARSFFLEAVKQGLFEESDWDNPEVRERYEKKPAKYHYFSSANKKSGCSAGALPGVYGLCYLDRYKSGEEKRAYILEGEKKAIVGSEFRKCIFVSLPGVGNFSVLEKYGIFDWFRSIGVERVVVANDMDMYDNPKVMEATLKTMLLARKHGYTVEQATWAPELGKGIDDAYLNGARVTVRPVKF